MVTQPRGVGGQFISKEKAENLTPEDLPGLVSKSSKMTGALKDIQAAVEEKKLEKPLFQFKVNNPLSWLMKWLERVKKKQTTTLTFKLGVPLIALPVIVVALLSFTVGMSLVQSEKEKKTKESKPSPLPVETKEPIPTGSSVISRAGTFKAVQYGSKTQYFIVLKNGDALKLEIPEETDVAAFYDTKVFVSGILNPEGNILKVENVTQYNSGDELEEPSATPVPYPNTSPSPTPSDLPLSSPIG